MSDIISEFFRMPQRTLLGYLFRRHGGGWLTGAIAGAIGLVIISIILKDIRFVILALMCFFIILPMAMAFLYLNYSLKPGIAFNTLPHAVGLSEEGIEILILKQQAEPESKPGKKKRKKRKSLFEDMDDPESHPIQSDEESEPEKEDIIVRRIIPFNKIGGYEALMNSVIIKLGNDKISVASDEGFIFLPASAFSAAEELKIFLENLYKSLSTKEC